jgi:hypothetical protein
MAQRSLDLIEAMRVITKAAQPITGRGVGYKLFIQLLIASMAKSDMQRVYRLLKEARERGVIPWEWIVDETRAIERVPTWADPDAYARCVAEIYRRDFWDQQPHRVQVWSEKGTVRGVLAPVLDHYAVGFLPVHGFSSATAAHEIAEDDDGRELIVLYVGDFDPSGLYMSEMDLPARFAKYNGHHITLKRIALTIDQLQGLPSFPATDKRKDPRYNLVRRQPWASLLGTRRHGPQRSSRLCRTRNPEADRTCRLAALRDRQQGRVGIAEVRSRKLAGATD